MHSERPDQPRSSTGSMIYFNCLTCAHRDPYDHSSCIVTIPFGVDLEGGELVIEETGQIFKMNSLIFKSIAPMHYNLH